MAGWINYYGRFGPGVDPVPDTHQLLPGALDRKKYERLAAKRKALAKMQEIAQRYPRMFAHGAYSADQRRADLTNRATRAE